jgi:hypothetical protein
VLVWFWRPWVLLKMEYDVAWSVSLSEQDLIWANDSVCDVHVKWVVVITCHGKHACSNVPR